MLLISTLYRQSAGIALAVFVYAGGVVTGLLDPRTRGGFRLPQRVPTEGILHYVTHNGPVTLMLAAGLLTGGVLTLLLLISNGVVLGTLFADAAQGNALWDAFFAVAPHAPFELAATMLAGAVGFAPVSVICRLALGQTVYTKTEARDMALLVGLALLLVVLAAAAEAWITPGIVEWKNDKA
jgi:uncharacterized membrane protein SpoIIM required for sporulation